MILKYRLLSGHMIPTGAAQGIAVLGVATIFKKTCTILAFLEARTGI